MNRENGVAVTDYTVNIFFYPLEHVAEATHEKYIAPIVAKQIHNTTQVCNDRACIFTEIKIQTYVVFWNKQYSDLFRKIILPHKGNDCNKKMRSRSYARRR